MRCVQDSTGLGARQRVPSLPPLGPQPGLSPCLQRQPGSRMAFRFTQCADRKALQPHVCPVSQRKKPREPQHLAPIPRQAFVFEGSPPWLEGPESRHPLDSHRPEEGNGEGSDLCPGLPSPGAQSSLCLAETQFSASGNRFRKAL